MQNCCTSMTSNSQNEAVLTILVDFLFLDDSVCKPCGKTAQALAEAIDLLVPPLSTLDIQLSVNRIHVTDQNVATEYKFLTSPTIRINGRDIDPVRTEESCPTCGDLAGGATPVQCRTWHWRGKVYQAAPAGKIVEAVMNEALILLKGREGCCASFEEDRNYEVPENLQHFFDARERNEKLCC